MVTHRFFPLLLLFTAVTASHALFAKPPGAASQPMPPVALWPNGAPGQPENAGPEVNKKPNGSVISLTNVTQPTLTVYPAQAANGAAPAVVVCPGGGYSILAYDLEGTEICQWLNSIGATAVLLKYRVPFGREKPLQDAQRAMGLVRLHAQEWNIDPKRLGIMGFSAGGHLSAMLSTHYTARTYPRGDNADDLSCRPDFAMLIYPAYLAAGRQMDQLAPEFTITSQTPPTFLSQTEYDAVHIEGSLLYFLALKKAKVAAELNVYPGPGHGYGLRPSLNRVATNWTARAAEWLKNEGFVGVEKDPASTAVK